ncbi:MAG TPA: hypothetical protein VN767_21490 [Streptosporangiaceae bacterium]|jgi:hypothetical protein|nr:hypothetical protein [Streptosporangiaceae bacterium]
MVTASTDLANLIVRYARTLGDVIGDGHHVSSPLGAWLLLALCSPAARGQDAAKLSEVLGADSGQAASTAADLLGQPPALVAAAAAVWNAPGAGNQDWLASLPQPVARGEVPDQDAVDRWAREHSFGLIDKFPLQIDAQVYLLLATALATKVSWESPFELAPGTELGGSWRLDQVLYSPDHPSHSAFIAITPNAGDVAVHVGRAQGGLVVLSVIAAPGVARADVSDAAHQLAIAVARNAEIPQRSLFDLPLGDGPLWSIREEQSMGGSAERLHAVLPAWSASGVLDLRDERLGFDAAGHAVGGGDRWDAKQAVMANYSRTGFEAAAVTALVARMAMRPRQRKARIAELRFGHPYAVVAAAQTQDGGPWHGLPLFSAWVTKPHNSAS